MMDDKFKINPGQQYNIWDLADSDSVKQLKKKIQADQKWKSYKGTDIELDITNHLLTYPATPKFIDLFLERLEKQKKSNKTLTIKKSLISYSEVVLLNLLVLEGDFFKINEKINSEQKEEIRKKVNEKLNTNKIKLIVNAGDKIFKYGPDTQKRSRNNNSIKK